MRSYSETLLDTMCFDEWQDAIDAEIDALPDAEMAEHLEDTADYEDDIEEREFIRRGGA